MKIRTKPMKYRHKRPGTIWFGKFWATIPHAAEFYGVTESTIRSRLKRGIAGAELIAPKWTADSKITDKSYKDKLKTLWKAYGQTPGDLAKEAGVTQSAMRYRIKSLDILEVLRNKRLLLEGWTRRQVTKARVTERLKEIEREKMELERSEARRREAAELAAAARKVVEDWQ